MLNEYLLPNKREKTSSFFLLTIFVGKKNTREEFVIYWQVSFFGGTSVKEYIWLPGTCAVAYTLRGLFQFSAAI